MAVIERGLIQNEMVVIDGQARLKPGMRVQPKAAP
jgi:hypothetical protein